MRLVAIIQARMGSSRLPGKTLADLEGEPLLMHVAERTEGIRRLDGIMIATTTSPLDDKIEELCRLQGWGCFRGSENDVLDRIYKAGKIMGAEHVLRITADDPLVCPHEAERVVSKHIDSGADYTHNITVWGSGMPLGTSCEIFSLETLEYAWLYGKAPHHREHVNEYIYEHPEKFHIELVKAPAYLCYPHFRLTVDQGEDLQFMRQIFNRLYVRGKLIELRDVIDLLNREPDLLDINRHVLQKRI